jgi:hypothetical protein
VLFIKGRPFHKSSSELKAQCFKSLCFSKQPILRTQATSKNNCSITINSVPQWLAFSSHEIKILKFYFVYTPLENWTVLPDPHLNIEGEKQRDWT